MTTLTHLECSQCGRQLAAGEPRNLCDCGGILLARYDLEHAREGYSRDWLVHAPASMWRYMPLLPAANPNAIVSLGEGMTPLVRARRLGEVLGAPNLWIKDEGVNPAGSVARGMSCAISMALDLNIREVSICSGGDAAAALAAYAAAAGIQARVVLPPDVRPAIYLQCRASGAQVDLSGAVSRRGKGFDLDALREPYRLEGAKTVGYELAEQSRWDLPDVILCPAGEGLELIGAWKGFEEMEAVGWISNKRPRMIAVEAETRRTLAAGLRVSQPLGERLMLAVLTASGGTTVAVSDQEMLDAGVELARMEGIFAGLEGAAAVAALRKLTGAGSIRPEERVAILNPSSGHNYLEAYATRFPRSASAEQDKLGGLITPR
jgi:threonine synthase